MRLTTKTHDNRHMMPSAETLLLYGSILVIVSLIFSKASFKFGIPTLLLFLGVGMLGGSFHIEFHSPYIAQLVSVMALTIILFSGGMDTHFQEIRPIIGPGIALATMGVLLTTLLTGTFIYYVLQWLPTGSSLTYPQALLCGAVMSSTDSASVFSILRSHKINLKNQLKPLIEFESGSNDPMAYMLTIILIQIVQANSIDAGWAIGAFLMQLILGATAGLVLGRLMVLTINKINLHSGSLYSILLLACAGLSYALTSIIGGNGFLAVYLAGLIVGNSKMVYKKSMAIFFDGFTWLWQLVMFLTLGLLVNVDALIHVAVPAILIGLFMTLFGRPIAVFLTLLPFKIPAGCKSRLFVSWVGLRGAVPIIFATYPWVAGINHSQLIFNIVFFITLVSLVVQGSTINKAARLLNLVGESPKEKVFKGVNLPEEIKSAISEIIVSEGMLSNGNQLKDISIPEESLAILIQRDGKYFVPRGHTELQVEDHVLLLSDDEKALVQAYEEYGINTYSMDKNY